MRAILANSLPDLLSGGKPTAACWDETGKTTGREDTLPCRVSLSETSILMTNAGACQQSGKTKQGHANPEGGDAACS